MSFWRRPFSNRHSTDDEVIVAGQQVEVSDGALKYIVQEGGNDSVPSYQEVTGAPVERDSPLGYTVGPITIVFLNVSKMIGTVVYSTRKFYL